MEYTFYYELTKSSKEAVTYNYTTKKFKTMFMYDVYRLDRHFFLPIGYELLKFDYLKYRSHESASVEMFKNFVLEISN